jgi:hypothetical protein
MNIFNRIFLYAVTRWIWGLMGTVIFGLSGCSGLGSTNSMPHYFWDSNFATKQVHPAVACTSLHALQTFNQLYVSGTSKDKLEEATMLGESSLYASDAPPASPCQSDFAFAASASPHQTQTYFTYPEYIVPVGRPDR